MQSPKPTTPPWRRTPTLAHVATQITSGNTATEQCYPQAPGVLRLPHHTAATERLEACERRPTRSYQLPSHHRYGSARRSSSSPTTVVSEPVACRARPCNGQLAAFVDAYVIVSQDSSMRSRTRSKGQGRRSRRGSRAFAFGPRAASSRTASAHLREQSAARAPPASQAHQHKLQAGGLRSNRARLAAGTAAKKVFSTPHSFAPCGAYSRGRPHAQEEDDRKAAHHLAIGAARRRIARSITQLE
jgi:hypothetical protein